MIISLISLIVFTAFLYVLHTQIFYVADDFCFATYKPLNILGVLTNSLNLYFTWSGRFIYNFLAFYFSGGEAFLWEILNPIVILWLSLMIWIISKVSEPRAISKISALLFILFIFLTLNQNIAREVLYWMNGTFYYLWPITISLTFLSFWIKSFNKTKFINYSKFICLITAAFVGNSHEQTGTIFVFLTFGISLYKMRQGFRLDRIQFITLLILLAGFVLLILAPGNFVRLGDSLRSNGLYFSGGIISNLNIRLIGILSVIFYSSTGSMFLSLFSILFLLAVINLIFSKILSNMIHKYILVLLLSISCLVSFLINPDITWKILMPVRTIFGTFFANYNVFDVQAVPTQIFWTISLFSLMDFGYILSRYDKSPIFFYTIVSTILSQLIMIVFPYSAYRSFFITVVFIVIAISYLIQRLDVRFINLIIFSSCMMLFIGGLLYYRQLIEGYRNNNLIMTNNEKIIKEYKNNNSASPLVLKRLANDMYGFNMPYINGYDYELICIRDYYGLKKNVKFSWIRK